MKRLLVFLLVFMVLASGCLDGNTSTGTPSSTPPEVETASTTSVEQVPPVEFLYPEKPEIVNLTLEDATEFFQERYSRVSYSQFGNITVNYSGGVFTGVYRFVLTNFTDRTLYLAVLKTADEPIKLNITIEGVPLNLSRVDRYILFDEGVGIEFYAVNVSTNLTTLRGVARYELRHLGNEVYISQMASRGIDFGTDFSCWSFASKNASITVTLSFPKDTVFVLFRNGVIHSGMKVVYTSPLRPYGGFVLYLPDLEWKSFEWDGVNFTVYFASQDYSEAGFGLVQKELTFVMELYSNLTGILPVQKFDVFFVPNLNRILYKRFRWASVGTNRGQVVLVDCRVDIEDSAVNYASLLFHEIAHQWAGHYAWFGYINEPLATFMQIEAYGRWSPDEYPLWLNNNEYRTLKYGNEVPFYEVLKDRHRYSYYTSYYTLYWKGAFVIRSLKFMLGDEKFSEAFRKLFEECHTSPCNVTAFEGIFEDVSGHELGWFFDEWFNSTLVPNYTVENLQVLERNSGYNLSFTIVDASNFTMPVPVRVYLENGDYVDETIWVNGTATVGIELPERPVKIVIDPYEWMANVNRKFEVEGIGVEVN